MSRAWGIVPMLNYTYALPATRRALSKRIGACALIVTSLGITLGGARRPELSVSSAPQAGLSPALVFQGVTVVDVRDGRRYPAQTVLIVGTRIAAVGPARTVRVPAGARRVAARGKYLIPGLWDMHIHVMGFPEVFYPLLIANGVTGIRDMGTPIPLDTVHQWQREVAAGTRVGPRQLNAGASLDDGGPLDCVTWHDPRRNCPFRRYPFLTPLRTPERARFVVESLQAAGADFIKVHDLGAPAVYFAVAAAARRLGLPFAGHAPDVRPKPTLLEAADSGQRSFEHTGGEEWCADDTPQARDTADTADTTAATTAARCRQLAVGLRRHNAWLVPTIAAGATDVAAPALRARLRYWPDSVTRGLWLADSTYSPAQLFGPAVTAARQAFARRAHAAQLPLLFGTDDASIFPWFVPGFSLQDAVILQAENGYPALDALQAGTLNPAKYLGATDSLGTVEPGKLADLVLLDADPLADLHHLRQIRAVVANGRYFDRAALDALLAGVAQRGAPHWAR